MKLPEFNRPGVNLEIPEDGRARKIAAVVIAALLILILAVTILFRVHNAGKTGGIQAIRRAGVLRVSVPSGSRTEEKPESVLSEKEAGLIRDIADQLGVETEFLAAADAEGALSMVRDGKAHLAVGSLTAGSVPEAMAGKVALSRAYETQALCAVTRRGDYSDSTAAFRDRKVYLSPTAKRAGFEPFPNAEEPTDSVEISGAYEMLGNHYLDSYLCTAAEAEKITALGKDIQSQLMPGEEGLNFVMAAADRALLDGVDQIILLRSEEAAGLLLQSEEAAGGN